MWNAPRFLLPALVGLALLAGRPAVAQEDAKDQARALSEKGQALYEQGHYLEAAAAFEGAQTLFSHPTNLFNAAKAYERAAEYGKAVEAYRAFLDLYQKQNGAAAPEATDVERTIAVLKDKAFLALPEITIDSDPSGADIAIDEPDHVVGQTPLVTHLHEGPHTVYLKRPAYQGFEKQFVVRSREPLRLTFALEKIKNEGGLRFQVNIRKARIYVDGKVQAVTPYLETLAVDAGTHQVMIEKERYNQVSRTVTVETGKVQDVAASLYLESPGFGWRGGIGITSFVLGAGAIVVSAAVLKPVADQEFQGSDRFKTFRTWTYVGYGVGSALAGLGVGLFIWEFLRKDVEADDLAGQPSSAPVVMGGVDERGRAWVNATARF